MNHSRLHNPKYVGPGIWFSMHVMAYNAKTQKEKEFVIKQIRLIQQNFPCQECKSHFWDYLNNHPPEATIKGDSEALFLWTVNFHNSVNYRNGYGQLSFEEAKTLYSGDGLYCMKSSCEDEGSEEENKTIEDKPVALKSPKRNGNPESKSIKSKSVSLVPSDMLGVKVCLRN